MKENLLLRKLKAGEAVFGVMLTFPSAATVEMLGHCGFDWILLDNEHGDITVSNVEDLVRASELTGITPIVRPVANRPDVIAPFLDRGAMGVQVPHVNTSAEAELAVDSVKYHPIGHRGIFSRSRPAEYGFGGSTTNYVKVANENTLTCIMLEEVEAIDNLESLVKVDGIDVYFIGSGDLSQSMGYPGQQTHPEVQEQMEKGVSIIKNAGKIAGVSCPDSYIPKFLDLGVQYFHSNVGTLIQTSSSEYLTLVRKSAQKSGL